MHWTNGSPVKRGGQLQIGLWLTTWHRASIPQVPGQGSWHFCEIQAWFWGHSELPTHSGLHDGGLPKKLGWQEHTAWPLVTLHTLFGPHGDGSQGFCGGNAVGKEIHSLVVSQIYVIYGSANYRIINKCVHPSSFKLVMLAKYEIFAFKQDILHLTYY